jgi:hypothetical protein
MRGVARRHASSLSNEGSGLNPAGVRFSIAPQVLLVQACPLRGPLPGTTAWTMTRTFTAEGPAYTQLLAGLAVLVLTIFGSALWLARVLSSWSRKIALLEDALGKGNSGLADLPTLPTTGEELDRLVDALNNMGKRLARERQRAAAAERLAAIGRLSAGLAHPSRRRGNELPALATLGDLARPPDGLMAIEVDDGRRVFAPADGSGCGLIHNSQWFSRYPGFNVWAARSLDKTVEKRVGRFRESVPNRRTRRTSGERGAN